MTETRIRRFVAFLVLGCASLNAQASPRADSAPALDETRLFTNLAILSADSMEGRLADSPGGARARAFLLREFALIGLQPLVKGYAVSFSATTPARNYPLILGHNLVGVVRGTFHPDRYIVVSAHYDHLGMRDGQIYHGADDNASGSAAILAIAEWTVAHPPLNSVIFAWFDAEELNIVGAKAWPVMQPFIDTVVALGLVTVR